MLLSKMPAILAQPRRVKYFRVIEGIMSATTCYFAWGCFPYFSWDTCVDAIEPEDPVIGAGDQRIAGFVVGLVVLPDPYPQKPLESKSPHRWRYLTPSRNE